MRFLHYMVILSLGGCTASGLGSLGSGGSFQTVSPKTLVDCPEVLLDEAEILKQVIGHPLEEDCWRWVEDDAVFWSRKYFNAVLHVRDGYERPPYNQGFTTYFGDDAEKDYEHHGGRAAHIEAGLTGYENVHHMTQSVAQVYGEIRKAQHWSEHWVLNFNQLKPLLQRNARGDRMDVVAYVSGVKIHRGRTVCDQFPPGTFGCPNREDPSTGYFPIAPLSTLFKTREQGIAPAPEFPAEYGTYLDDLAQQYVGISFNQYDPESNFEIHNEDYLGQIQQWLLGNQLNRFRVESNERKGKYVDPKQYLVSYEGKNEFQIETGSSQDYPQSAFFWLQSDSRAQQRATVAAYEFDKELLDFRIVAPAAIVDNNQNPWEESGVAVLALGPTQLWRSGLEDSGFFSTGAAETETLLAYSRLADGWRLAIFDYLIMQEDRAEPEGVLPLPDGGLLVYDFGSAGVAEWDHNPSSFFFTHLRIDHELAFSTGSMNEEVLEQLRRIVARLESDERQQILLKAVMYLMEMDSQLIGAANRDYKDFEYEDGTEEEYLYRSDDTPYLTKTFRGELACLFESKIRQLIALEKLPTQRQIVELHQYCQEKAPVYQSELR